MEDVKITKAVFAGSCQRLRDKPKLKRPEFAFIGRSNVGKSSLINSLCGMNNLAHTSSTPGKTLMVNHFIINDSWFLVDLPGYGYARVSRTERERLAAMNHEYITRSEELAVLFVLLDARHDLQKIDLEFLIRLGEEGIPFALVFTKADKLGRTALEQQIQKNKTALLEYWEELPPVFVSSAVTRQGRQEILDYIHSTLNTL